MASITLARPRTTTSALTSGRLPKWSPWAGIAAGQVLAFAVVGLFHLAAVGAAPADEAPEFPWVGGVVFGAILYVVGIVTISGIVEGRRKAADRLVTSLVVGAFIIAMIPLVSLLWTTVAAGWNRLDLAFFTQSMQGIYGEGGGALHAIIGTLLVTLAAAIISIPIGLMASIYLVEYGRGALARGITFFVDVMTGIPSIVAGLFAFALLTIFLGPGHRSGLAGAIALSVLMIPVVVRSSEEMLRIVPNELREASLALGVPKWLTIVKVVLPTSIGGIVTGVILSIARVIGETAPLLITAGYIAGTNYNLFDGRMTTLPLFVYQSYRNSGGSEIADIDRAWTGALVLILIVMALNLIARLVAKFFAPKKGR